MLVYLVGYLKRMLFSQQSTVLLVRRHLNTMLFINFENLNYILHIFQENTRFLSFDGHPVIVCIYLKTHDRHFRDQGNVRCPTSKLLKCDFVQTLKTFRNPVLRIFATE